MKKVSTMAAKQSRNFSQQKLTIGLDLGDRSSYSCVLDETDCGAGAQGGDDAPKLFRQRLRPYRAAG